MLIHTLQVVVTNPGWLHATTVQLVEGIGLSVYRSAALPANDSWLRPVRQLLDTHRHELLWRNTVEDPDMMFGEAEHTMYKLGG